MDLFLPKVAHAGFDEFLSNVSTEILNPLILLIFALALVYFLYGMFEFISNADNEEKRSIGKNHMLWGIIGLTIMVGVWFILGVVLRTINVPESQINPKEGTVNLPNYNP
jgi:uncharacterized membrane protein YidH (DUF202 family)